MPNSRSTRSGVIELIEGYDMTCVYRWHRPHLREWQARGGVEKWKPLGTLFGDIFRCGRESDEWGGAREPKKSALFSFSLCQNTAALLYSFLSLCQNYFWLQRRKCLLCGLVHWSHAVFPPSKSAVLSPKWFAYFPCNTRLKKDERKSRGKGEPLLLYLELHAVSCSAGLKAAVWQLRHRSSL